MLAALLASPQFLGSAATDQVAQVANAYGVGMTSYGSAASDQVAQTADAAGQMIALGIGATAQSTQSTLGDSRILVAGSGGTMQRAQRTRGAGTGPARGVPRPLRLSRGDSTPRRPVIITIKSGA